MNRDQAYQLLTKYLTNQNLLKHSLATEAAMQAIGRYFGEEEIIWGITGLLHDADYQIAKGHPEKHGLLLFEKEPHVIPEDIEQAIKSHNYEWTKILPKTRMDWSLVCCDELTALILASVLVHPQRKLHALTLEFVMNKIRQSNFKKGAERKNLYLCEEKLNIPLLEFVTMTLKAMQNISDQLGM